MPAIYTTRLTNESTLPDVANAGVEEQFDLKMATITAKAVLETPNSSGSQGPGSGGLVIEMDRILDGSHDPLTDLDIYVVIPLWENAPTPLPFASFYLDGDGNPSATPVSLLTVSGGTDSGRIVLPLWTIGAGIGIYAVRTKAASATLMSQFTIRFGVGSPIALTGAMLFDWTSTGGLR